MHTGVMARTWALTLTMAAGQALAPGCTLLLGTDAVQCRDNSSCARFANSVCDVTNGVCVPRPAPPDGLVDADAGQGLDAHGDGAPGDGGSSRDGAAAALDQGMPADRAAANNGTDGRSNGACPDLDHNGIMDCRESLIANPDFGAGAAGWTAEFGVTQLAPGNAVPGNPASGAIAIVNTNQSNTAGSSMAGSTQCLAARADVAYGLDVEVMIPVTEDANTLAGAALQTFPTPDCSGPANAVVSPALIDAASGAGSWQVVHAMVPAPAGTMSMSVRLVVVKTFERSPAQALFDNVLLKAR